MFFIFVAATLGITYWASKRTKSARDFYTAGAIVSLSGLAPRLSAAIVGYGILISFFTQPYYLN